MTSIPHEPVRAVTERRRPSLRLAVSEISASIAIAVIWLAVLFDAVFGPSIVTSTAGGDHSSVPSAVVVSIFAFLATLVVARRGFPRDR
jgi:hypothetical protein